MGRKRRILNALALLACIAMLSPCRAAHAEAPSLTTLTNSVIGTEDGYGYELWKDRGDTTMVLTGDGTFTCEWSNINNALFRRGVKFDSTQTYQEIGDITVDYEVAYHPNGNSYLCVYGWTREPLVEYYIVESWGTWRPPGGSAIGTITVDDAAYDVYKTVRVNQPSIDGTATFEQYWSVRKEKRTEGTIDVSAHFAAWESMGLTMGKMYEAALTVEGYQSAGAAEVLKNELTIDGAAVGSRLAEPPTTDENGCYFHATFEDSQDGWASRGNTTVALDRSVAAEGAQSLAVTGRGDTWHGTGRDLSTDTFVPGAAYSFSVMVMQDQVDAVDFKLTLQYNTAGGTSYASIAESPGARGEWVQLSNPSFTIPEGASGLLLYVETISGTDDFYIDEAIAAEAAQH